MSASLRTAAALLAALVIVSPASASHTRVPDDVSSISAAILSGVDTIFVQDGDYNEYLEVTRPLTLMPQMSVSGYSLGFPRVTGMTISALASSTPVNIQSFYFRERVTFGGVVWGPVNFNACEFDSGLTAAAGTPLSLRGCTIRGGLAGSPYSIDMTACTVLGGGVDVGYEGYANLRYNHIEGPAAVALRVSDFDGGLLVKGNTVVGATDAMSFDGAMGAHILENRIHDCAGIGIRSDWSLSSGNAGATLEDNDLRRLGGTGMVLSKGWYKVVDNTVDSVGGFGVYGYGGLPWPLVSDNLVRSSGSNGLYLLSSVFALRNNVVLRAGSDGIVMTQADSVDHNVVGRSNLQGIRITGSMATVRLRDNTSYLNMRSGYQVTLAASDSVDHNIAYGNMQYGLDVLGASDPRIACDDWYLNALGAVNGAAVAPTDIAIDPMFCDLPDDDVFLSRSSPLLSYGSCGRIGARGSGCQSPAGVEGGPRFGALRAYPRPARAGVRLEFAPYEAPMRLEVYDITGARRWGGDLPAGARTFEWPGRDDSGRALPAGVYFARLTRAGATESARVVLVR